MSLAPPARVVGCARTSTHALDPGAVITRMKRSLPAYMVPNRILSLDAMPLNTSGKVDRRALLAALQAEAE